MKVLALVALIGLLTVSPQDAPKTAAKRPEVGKVAPALRLNDHHGNIVELGGKRTNWTVLAFFPKAATPG